VGIWKDKAGQAAARRRWRETNGRAERLAHRLGIPIKAARVILATKTEQCEICGIYEDAIKAANPMRALCYDHDHATGKHRGWLCDRCNLGIAKFEDSPELLRAAALYLETA
jgi:Recombination endonuclease VII